MQAQNADLYGTLVTGKANAPVSNANVLLVRMNGDKADSTYRVSSAGGTFSYKGLPPGKVYIKVTAIGMNASDGIFDLTEGDNAVLFTMSFSREEIAEASVIGNIPLMRMLADTTIFNAAAVKTMPGERAMAILEQLPGFDINGSTIKYRGRKISRTYVNGVQLFGDDASNAFRQLKAEEVSQIRTYEERNPEDERRGLKNSRRERVIDVKTKEKILSLSSIRTQTAAGADGEKADGSIQGRYLARASFDFNSEKTSSSAYFGADNLVSPVEGITPGGMISLTTGNFGPLQKYGENIGGQIWTERHWKDRRYGNGIGVGYSYSHTYARSAENEIADYYPTSVSTERTSIDSSLAMDIRNRHDFLVNGDFKDTPLKSIAVSMGGKIISDNDQMLTASDVTLPGKHMIRNAHSGTRRDDVEINGSIIWKNNDLGKIRPTFTAEGTYEDNNTLSWNTDTLASSYIRRNLQSDGLGKSWRGKASANLEIILENSDKYTSQLRFGAFAGNERSTKRNLTVDVIDPANPVRDLANTYDFTWNTMSYGLNQEFTLSSRSTHLILSLAERLSSQKDDERLPSGSSFSHRYLCISPTFRYDKGLRSISISANPQIPSVEQTRDRISDANPLVLTGGNPDLRQTYTVSFAYSDNLLMNKETGFNIGMFVNSSCTFDPIVNRSFYFMEDTVLDTYDGYIAHAGSILNTFTNASRPAYSAEGGLNFSKRSGKAKLKSAWGLSGGTESRPQYISNNLARVSMTRVRVSVSELFRPSVNFMLNFIANSTYAKASSDASGSIAEAIVTNAALGIRYEFSSGFFMNPKATAIWHRYLYGPGKNEQYVPASIEVGKRFKKSGLVLTAGAYDLLNRGSEYSTSATADSYMQKWKPSYGRYYLVNLVYEFYKRH